MRQQYEPSADRIIALYQQLEDDILSAVIRRILKMGYVSEASKHQLEVLQAAGLLYDDIVQLIADRTDACTAQVKALFEDAGVQTVEIDNSLHEAAGALPIDIRQDSSTRQVLETGYKKTLGTMQNLVSTTATQTQTAFIQTCDRIYMQVSSGAFSYQEAIMNALRALADTGAEVVYPTKHKDRMDVAIRRCVLTGVSQTAAAVSLRQAEDAGCYLMEITAHSGARPDHAEWQGQLVTITGKNAGKIIDGLRVFTLSEIGYGSGEGFKGWNCRHNWHAYYPGFSTPNYTPEELKKLDEPCISYNGKLYTEYEVSQMQRAQERKVRAWKRRCVTAQESVNSATDEATNAAAQAEFDRSARYLKTNEAKLKDFCRQTGQDRDRFREQVLGFNKSTAQKAVHAAKKSGLTSGGKDGIINIERPMAAKTFDKAAKYAKEKLNLSIENISELPVEKVNKINNTIWEIYKDVPMIRGSISEILLEPTSKIASASMIWRENTPKLRLKLSKELFSNLSIKELENNIQSLVESGWFSPKDGLHGIFKHEATHFAEYIKTLEKYHYQKEAVIKSLDECELAKQIMHTAFVNCGLDESDAVIQNYLGGYACDNPAEFIAEAFSSTDNNVLVNEVKRLLSKKWGL
nr:MAG TPA: minor capsid protein [Caudoviricetes sp.]